MASEAGTDPEELGPAHPHGDVTARDAAENRAAGKEGRVECLDKAYINNLSSDKSAPRLDPPSTCLVRGRRTDPPLPQGRPSQRLNFRVPGGCEGSRSSWIPSSASQVLSKQPRGASTGPRRGACQRCLTEGPRRCCPGRARAHWTKPLSAKARQQNKIRNECVRRWAPLGPSSSAAPQGNGGSKWGGRARPRSRCSWRRRRRTPPPSCKPTWASQASSRGRPGLRSAWGIGRLCPRTVPGDTWHRVLPRALATLSVKAGRERGGLLAYRWERQSQAAWQPWRPPGEERTRVSNLAFSLLWDWKLWGRRKEGNLARIISWLFSTGWFVIQAFYIWLWQIGISRNPYFRQNLMWIVLSILYPISACDLIPTSQTSVQPRWSIASMLLKISSTFIENHGWSMWFKHSFKLWSRFWKTDGFVLVVEL